MKSLWKKLFLTIRTIFGWWAIGSIILIIILSGYGVPWTGFGDYTTPTGEFVRGKTLWNWMELLIIPFFLAAGAIAVNRSERKNESLRAEERAKLEREIALDRQQEAALQVYIDRMSDLLVNGALRNAENKEVHNVARIRTLTLLRGLDVTRKGMVLLFLHEAELINGDKPTIDLSGANFENIEIDHANLTHANLFMVNLYNARFKNAYLEGANLTRANLSFADLAGANLEGANLTLANLSNTNLENSNLKSSTLYSANMKDAKLAGASLKSANLTGINFSDNQLEKTKSLKGAIMPDGTIHE